MSIDVETLIGRRATNRWERVSVGDVFERVRWSRPDAPALVGAPGAFAHAEHERLTYAEADRLATRVANALLGRGLRSGDRVLLFCDNSIEAFVTKIGIAKAGLVCTPVNTMMATDVIAYLIGHVEPAFAIADAALWPRSQEAFEQAGLRLDVTIEIGGDVVEGSESFGAFVAGVSEEEPDVAVHGDDVWELLFTSGTTAMPKAVMITHTYSYIGGQSMALSLTRGLPFEDELRLCSFLPLIFHVGDQVFGLSAFLSGGTLILGRTPDPQQMAATLAAERITGLWAGSPAMLGGLVAALDDAPELDVASLTAAAFGWAALPPATLDALRRRCGPTFQVYGILGQTEAVSCHRFWPDKHPDLYARTAPAENYIGVSNPIQASRIVDDAGEEIPLDVIGVAGEAVYRSPAITAGYYRDEEATRTAFRDGWFHSGDSLAHGEAGQRVMLDRVKDIVKSGGESVSSLRVEAVLNQHADVAACAVIGLAHDHWGEAVTAFVVAAPGATVDASGLVEWARGTLAGFEAPKSIVVVDELPTTVGGKVLKHKLRARHADHYQAS